MHADAQAQPLSVEFPLGEALLNAQRCSHGRDDTVESGKNGVSGSRFRVPVSLGNDAEDELLQLADRSSRAFVVFAHERAEAAHVGKQNRAHAAREGFLRCHRSDHRPDAPYRTPTPFVNTIAVP